VCEGSDFALQNDDERFQACFVHNAAAYFHDGSFFDAFGSGKRDLDLQGKTMRKRREKVWERREKGAYGVGRVGEMRNAETEGFGGWLLAEAGTEVSEGGSEVEVVNDVVSSVLEHLQDGSTTEEVAAALLAPVVYQTCDAIHCCKMQNAKCKCNHKCKCK